MGRVKNWWMKQIEDVELQYVNDEIDSFECEVMLQMLGVPADVIDATILAIDNAKD